MNFAVAWNRFCLHSVRALKSYMSRRTRKNVGVIGLGIIGSRVTANLRKKGFHVFVWNRTPRPVPNFVGAPGEIAEMCDFVQIFVSDDDALLDVCRQLAPALAPRHVVIAHSTVAPQTMREAADMVARRGARFVEAPFTGSKKAAENGDLIFYVGGDEMAIQEARAVLEASSKDIMMIGEIGQATAIKLATNMITAASVQAGAEALALVHTAGVPLEKLVEALESNASNSKTLAMKLPKMIATNFEPHFSVKHMLKDVQIASRIGLTYHLELGVTAATRYRLLEQMQHGYADEDYSAVARKYFAVLSPPEREQPVPELIEQQAGPGPSLQPLMEILQSEQSGAPVPAVPETTREPESHAHPVIPIPEFTPIGPSPEDRQSKPERTSAAIGRTAAPESSRESTPEEEEERRGFLSRLLWREIDY
jgi:3-hydroxyisobutyrate dehydrogenase-like beta-hydroxyacid dehydrogenase